MIQRIIVLTGIDGAGKTVQSQLLVDHFRKKGEQSRLVQQFAPSSLEKPLLKIAGPMLKKLERYASNKPYFKQQNIDRESFLKLLFRICSITRIVCRGFIRSRGSILSNRASSIIIFDRYFYDEIIKIKWMYGISDRLERTLMKLVPKPFLLIYLDVAAERAWARETDRETTLEQHRFKKEIYDAWFGKMKKINGNFYRVDIESNENETHLEIISILKKSKGEE